MARRPAHSPLRPNQERLLVGKLLRWYRSHRRDLPWRQTSDPYRIWVSEAMLQQTQVATMQPYYERFIAVFPTLTDLAHASPDRVLKRWEGLGYYARARRLHRAAQRVVHELGGVMPDSVADLRRLPGIGPYTAGAIASIAFGHDEPALDGNAMRVLARLFKVTGVIERTSTKRTLWQLARVLLPPGEAGDFNQALMELGATICVPQRPHCPSCPVGAHCAARHWGCQDQLPVRRIRKPRPHYHVAVGIIWRGDQILIAKRSEDGLLGGLWEFPGGKREPGESWQACLKREVREELGVEIEVGKRLTVVEHGYTHFLVTLHAFRCQYRSGKPRSSGCSSWAWVRRDELADYAFPAANRKIFESV